MYELNYKQCLFETGGGGQKPPNSEGEHANDDTTLRDFVLQDTETVCQSKQYEIAFHVGKWSLLSQ